MAQLNGKDIKELLCYIAEKTIENKDYLTELDSAIGDGDHGIGMVVGMESVLESLNNLDDIPDPYTVFTLAGRSMLMSMGGASGVIFGSLFMAGAKGQEQKKELNTSDLAALFNRSLRAIQTRGGAQVGDKTMVDALAPAVKAMQEHSESGFRTMLEAAAEAAYEGMESTKKYHAKQGRAKSLGERSLGHRDAGAASTWIIFRSMAEWVKHQC